MFSHPRIHVKRKRIKELSLQLMKTKKSCWFEHELACYQKWPKLGSKKLLCKPSSLILFLSTKVLLYSPIDEKSNEVITLSLKFLLVIKSVASEFCKKTYKTQSKSLHFNVFYWWSLTSEECKSRGADMQRELAVQTCCYCKSLFFATTHSLSQSVSQSVTPSQ